MPRAHQPLPDGGARIRTVSINQEGTTDIVDVTEKTTQVFPNPFCNQITVKANAAENTFAVLQDITGKTISTTRLNTDVTNINTSLLAKGVYLLNITSNGKIATTQKVVKAE